MILDAHYQEDENDVARACAAGLESRAFCCDLIWFSLFRLTSMVIIGTDISFKYHQSFSLMINHDRFSRISLLRANSVILHIWKKTMILLSRTSHYGFANFVIVFLTAYYIQGHKEKIYIVSKETREETSRQQNSTNAYRHVRTDQFAESTGDKRWKRTWFYLMRRQWLFKLHVHSKLFALLWKIIYINILRIGNDRLDRWSRLNVVFWQFNQDDKIIIL